MLKNNKKQQQKTTTERDTIAFVKGIVNNLRNRFPNVELYKAAMIFDPSNITSSVHEFRTYGESELVVLCTTYSK